MIPYSIKQYQVPSGLPRLFSRPDRLHSPLYVLTVVFDPQRFRTRWKLYQDFALECIQAGAILYTAEVAFGKRDFVLTDPDNPHHLQVRTSHELWFKENTINLLIQRLPIDWQYVATIDADVSFVRNDWADEVRHKLQHHPVVQMWTQAHDLTPRHELLQRHQGLVKCFREGIKTPTDPGDYYYPGKKGEIIYFHPGYAWAYTREAWNALGGLMDFCPLGAADYHMAWSLIGNVERTIDDRMHPRYQFLLKSWGHRADKAVKRNVGVMDGLILHYWHGSKVNRGYNTRGKILIDTQYNPDVDLYRDYQGLWQLTDRSYELRDRMRQYFAARDEDNTHLEEEQEAP